MIRAKHGGQNQRVIPANLEIRKETRRMSAASFEPATKDPGRTLCSTTSMLFSRGDVATPTCDN